MATDRCREALDALLANARATAPEASVFAWVSESHETNTRFARNTITSCGDATEMRIWVELAFGGRHAGTSTNQTDATSLRTAVSRAAKLARVAPEDPEYMPPLGAQSFTAAPAANDEATRALDAAARASTAGAAVREAERAGLVGAGFYRAEARRDMIGSSAGLFGEHRSTYVELSTTLRTKDGTGSGWASRASTRASEIDGAALARVAAEKAERSRGAKRAEPGRYTVVLEPAAVGDLLSFLTGSLGAREADEGRSFFSKAGGGTRLGETLCSDAVTLVSDPWDPTLPAAPFDDEGLPRKAVTWVERGVLRTLRDTRYWAKKQGRAPLASHEAWHLHGGEAESIDALVRGTAKGLLVTRFHYLRWVDPRSMLITGLTRDGVFRIEGGQVVEPVNNFRFNESPVVMLKNVEAMTKETWRPVTEAALRVPALRTAEFTMASTSDAV